MRLKACVRALHTTIAEIEHLQKTLIGTYDEGHSNDVTTADLDEANTGDVLSDEAAKKTTT